MYAGGLATPPCKVYAGNLVTTYCYTFIDNFGDLLLLKQNGRVSSFYKTRGSKLCFLTSFSYFSCYFHILVFSRNHYLLISSRLSRLHGNPISCPISCTLGTPSWYVVHAPPCFWHRTRGFLKAKHSWEPGSRLTTGEFSPFRLSPKVSVQTFIGQTRIIPFLLSKILKLTILA